MRWTSQQDSAGENEWMQIHIRVPYDVGRALLSGGISPGAWRETVQGELTHDLLPGGFIEYSTLEEPIVARLAREQRIPRPRPNPEP